jgi:hypothetical protein
VGVFLSSIQKKKKGKDTCFTFFCEGKLLALRLTVVLYVDVLKFHVCSGNEVRSVQALGGELPLVVVRAAGNICINGRESEFSVE